MGQTTLYLECMLSDDEVDERMRELTNSEIQRNKAEIELAGESETWARRKKELQARVSAASTRCRELANAAKTKREMRNVECRTEVQPPHHLTIRLDTGEIIHTRAATSEELQLALPMGGSTES